MKNTVKCLICEKELSSLSYHVRMIHRLSIQDYLSTYPGSKINTPHPRPRVNSSDPCD